MFFTNAIPGTLKMTTAIETPDQAVTDTSRVSSAPDSYREQQVYTAPAYASDSQPAGRLSDVRLYGKEKSSERDGRGGDVAHGQRHVH